MILRVSNFNGNSKLHEKKICFRITMKLPYDISLSLSVSLGYCLSDFVHNVCVCVREREVYILSICSVCRASVYIVCVCVQYMHAPNRSSRQWLPSPHPLALPPNNGSNVFASIYFLLVFFYFKYILTW